MLFDIDWHEQARVLINSALREVSADGTIPRKFPKKALRDFAQFGRSLQDDEYFDLATEQEETSVLDKSVRQRIVNLADLDMIEIEKVTLGQITGLQSDPQKFDFLLVSQTQEKRKIQGSYTDPQMWGLLHEFQGYGESSPLTSLSVVAKEDRNGELVSIIDVLGVEPALPPDWADRVSDLNRIQDGWLESDTPAPSIHVMEFLEEILLECLDEDLPRPLMFPSANGGIQLEWRGDTRNIEIEILNVGKCEAIWFDNDGDSDGDHNFENLDLFGIVDFIVENVNV